MLALADIVPMLVRLNWNYQKIAAERAVRYLVGVKGISNVIDVKGRCRPSR